MTPYELRGGNVVEIGLSGREVLVFGATGALGAGLASAFADMGATVKGVSRSVPAADRQLTGVQYESVDVLDDAALGEYFEAAGAPWAVINTVGGYAPKRPLAELDGAELAKQIEVNLMSAALITKHALRVMKAAGEGRIVHTASRAATVTAGNGFAYSVSKLGVLHLVAMAADEVRGTRITVNCVVPSIIDTPVNREALPNADHDAWPKVRDIAINYIYLASPDAHLVNGAAIPV
jgi:NAD(P)-dependent dehydrogenase (short-subunit alcohol dehydrogenase family)